MLVETIKRKQMNLGLIKETKLPLRQEIDGPQARHLQLASCLLFMGQEKKEWMTSGGTLTTSSIDGLQFRYLQPASCLHFKIEITT